MKIYTRYKQEGLAFILLLIISIVLFLLNYNRFHYSGAFTYRGNLNADSPYWLSAAENFPISTIESIWLSRPVYPMLTNILTHLFQGDVYISFRFLNYLTYFLSAYLYFMAILLIEKRRINAFMATIFYMSSYTVLAWLGQPLPQILDYLVISFVFYLYAKWETLEDKDSLTLIQTLPLFLLMGVLMLIKPYLFIPILGVVLFIYQRNIKQLSVFALSLVVPYLSWYYYVTKIYNVPFYDHSLNSRFKQLTWILDDIKIGNYLGLIEAVPISLRLFFESTASAFIIAIIFIVGLMLLNPQPKGLPICYSVPAIYFFSLLLVSYAMNGYYPPRIGFYLFPFIFWLLAVNLNQLLDNFKRGKTVLVFTVILLYLIVNHFVMPYYSFS